MIGPIEAEGASAVIRFFAYNVAETATWFAENVLSARWPLLTLIVAKRLF
jgi:hypothetical protein